jgi:hypothetical protein
MFRTRTTARTPNSRGKLITEGKKKNRKSGKTGEQIKEKGNQANFDNN